MKQKESYEVTPDELNREDYNRYLKDLKLREDDLRHKSILDIGVGRSGFTKYIKDHQITDKVFGITNDFGLKKIKEREGTIMGLAEEMPFGDESFDLVVSNTATPNEFTSILYESLEIVDGERTVSQEAVDDLEFVIKNYVSEILRITKKGGEIRLGNIFTDTDPLPEQRLLYQIFVKALEEIALEKAQVTIDDDLCIIKLNP